MKKLFQSSLYDLEPYIPGEQPGISKKIIKLNTNENPYPPSPKIKNVINQIIKKGFLRRYPNPSSEDLRKAIAQIHDISPENVLVTNGSDEGLALLFKAVLSSKSKVIVPYPTYSLYPVLTKIQMNSTSIEKIPLLDDLHFDFKKLKKAKGELLAFASPNAPTGILEDENELLNLISHFSGLVICDEAYIDFSPPGSSLIHFINKFQNLVVSRTLSKSYSLAGLRVGYLISNTENIKFLNKLKDSYNLGMIEQQVAIEAIKDRKYFDKIIRMIIKSRNYLSNELTKMLFIVTKSETNFLFVKPPLNVNPLKLFEYLRKKNIFIRYFKDDICKHYIRITVGTQKENKILIKEIQNYLLKKNDL